MKNKKIIIALLAAALLITSGFAFAEGYNEEGSVFNRGFGPGGFFGGPRGHHRSMASGEDFTPGYDDEDRGFFGRRDHCLYYDLDDEEMEAYRDEWMKDRNEAIDNALEEGEITEEEASYYRERLEDRERWMEEEGFHRGPGHRRGGHRGPRW